LPCYKKKQSTPQFQWFQNKTFGIDSKPEMCYLVIGCIMKKEERKTKQDQYVDKMVDHLPTLRAAAKITQNQLAKKLGVARSTMVIIESRGRKLQWHMYLAMVLVFTQNEDSRKLLKSFQIFNDDFLQKIV